MKTNKSYKLYFLFFCLILSILFFFQKTLFSAEPSKKEKNTAKTSGAGKSLDIWAFERSYPNRNIPTSKYIEAFNHKKNMIAQKSNLISGEWESLGPENIGGRTLCLAFHPTNENIIFAGSASSGLWKTTTQGIGRYAWEQIPTGFPVLGVAAIVIDQNDPETIYIGTGETYGENLAEPVTVNRLIRGTYGIGILKSINGGTSWSKILNFEPNEIKGVQDIEINKLNNQEIYAATTDGLYQSLDSGNSWNLVLNETNCIDIEIDPTDGDIIYVTKGNLNHGLNPALSGIYKSTDKGVSFTKLVDSGLITAWSGSSKLTLDPTNSNIIYASIQMSGGATNGAGIFKSTDAGNTWNNINNQNIAAHQGWYSHDLAINPLNNTEIIAGGFDMWKSTNSGVNFTKHSNWSSWVLGEISVDFPEGGDDYVHADIHAVYYHPINNKVFMATDGGVFTSDTGEQPFTTKNGGLQTSQFYANMGSSATNPNFCIGGMQDNATFMYMGSPSWSRTIGGDGLSASVNQDNDQIVYGSVYNLNIYKSTDGGTSFSDASPTLESGDYPAFSAPYELAPTNQNIIYGGGKYLYKTLDNADNWNAVTNQPVDNGNYIVKIGISPLDPDLIYLATTPDPLSDSTEPVKVLKSTNGGVSFTVMLNLPNRICKDIEFDPIDDSIVYLTFSGFGTNHIYKTTDHGNNWNAIDLGLPDLPTNTILIDPLNSNNVYVGNDIGVYYSEDSGATWQIFSDALPEATMIYDLNNSPSNRKIRIATHGHGIWERSYVNDPLSVETTNFESINFNIYPNPAFKAATVSIKSHSTITNSKIEIFSILGQKVVTVYEGSLNQGSTVFPINFVDKFKTGTYFVILSAEGKIKISKQLIIK